MRDITLDSATTTVIEVIDGSLVVVQESETSLLEINSETIVLVEEDNTFVIESIEQGPPGPKGDAGSSINLIYVAASPISGHRAVTLNANGELRYASNDVLKHAYRVMGISLNAASPAGQVNVINKGELTESSWNWDITKPIYLGLEGHLTQIPPTQPISKFIIVVGFPISPNKIFVDIKTPITLI